jgi:hypothetical protein
MGSSQPTAGERRFLRALAAVNPHARRPGDEDWWSPYDLQHTALFPDFRDSAVLSLAATGRSCVTKGLAASRRIGTRGHGWTEHRATSYGRGLVADSCIGGGLRWAVSGAREPACPACLTSAIALGVQLPAPGTVPAHSLPGYAPPAHETQTGRGDHGGEQSPV